MLIIVFLFICAFIIGGIPTGYLIVKIAKKKDIRNYGSGNIGFTNVFRVAGLKLAVFVLIIDVLKAFLTAYLFSFLTDNFELYRVLFGISVILGNIFSPFLGFKGGKGVATGLGVAIAISPFGVIAAILIFLIMLLIFKYVSVGSLSAAFIFMVTNIILYLNSKDIYRLTFSILLFLTVTFTHRENIKRLISGTENKIGKRER